MGWNKTEHRKATQLVSFQDPHDCDLTVPYGLAYISVNHGNMDSEMYIISAFQAQNHLVFTRKMPCHKTKVKIEALIYLCYWMTSEKYWHIGAS